MQIENSPALARETANSFFSIGVMEISEHITAHNQIGLASAQLLKLGATMSVKPARCFTRIERLDVTA